ncbi:acyl-CoA dehydratase activase [Kosmotoga pacifica]|uniref:2-hydroxyglutaryl-CoA dehydratase n=1 Tax=Kosmotoga pacifica TaxID=1330330 RepID=A0A0G2ZDQ0_9BACT|nr:acyl-CoA dehydratase activase [Kosmotoga pacifica]AKI97674.1 2-hydroxyglutaryl-CoA dehydratase [Kosmotoga pacifica]
MDLKSFGVCVGSSSISYYDGIKGENVSHHGNPMEILKELIPRFLRDGNVIVTGRKAKNMVKLPQIPEVEATEIAYNALRDKYGVVEGIVSAGGENFILYKLNKKGLIAGIYTGSKCASGTGEFFLQQLKRMDVSLDFANSIEVDECYELSSRCTVFCKSDCTHALNKCVPKELILNGLGKVMAEKVMELVHKSGVKKIMLVGGTARNKVMVKHLLERIDLVIPDEALFFEAFGAHVWGKRNSTSVFKVQGKIFMKRSSSFSRHAPLKKFLDMVEFKKMNFEKARNDDVCILGVDVGSTTTKAVLVRLRDNAILTGSYLRTLGDPIKAVKNCYNELIKQLNGINLRIIGVGITGSGRKIVGLHSQTNAVYNEITAHARAAAYFDPEVDTIFEIGGQDAKYTYLVNRVPTDYSMNEACSAGTGSFLEEATRESLEVHYLDIGDLALKSESPPNFSDQCAAFISSDVKTAIHEGLSKEDICAGLVYSICMNYLNRVKGNRSVGKKIIMQGGVCYNRAVPAAMAALTGKRVVIPPHPGLMGAYGVALIVKENITQGFLKSSDFDLRELANREVQYKGTFICSGGKNSCDRKCEIRIIEINGKRFPFGGACNRYENIVRHVVTNTEGYNYVKKREEIIFNMKGNSGEKTIGISRSLAMTTLFPLFYRFFRYLGFRVIIPEVSDKRGWDLKNAEFCFPVEMAHGYMYDLLARNPDYVFLPRIRGVKVENSRNYNVFCPFVQSEPDYLKSAFSDLEPQNVLEMNLDFSNGYENEVEKFEEVAEKLGIKREEGKNAYLKTLKDFKELKRKIKKIGESFLKDLEKEEFGIVLFGRSYNAFSSHANMGIPEKFASRGVLIVNLDALPYESEEGYSNMYWTCGEMITKAARYVKKHPKLFGVYITNFSCGPDSFIISYFRDIMGDKPSLILELDSHTADAGIETRIEAFIDVARSYLKAPVSKEKRKISRPITKLENGELKVITPDGSKFPISHEKVRLVFPTMGGFSTKCLAASFRYHNVKTDVCPIPGIEEFKLGRGNSLSKECLPLQLTLGSLIKYLNGNSSDDKIILYFIPETMGPCRFGQYKVFIDLWLDNNHADNVALFSLNSENAYTGLGLPFKLRIWTAVIVSDVLTDIENTVKVLAKDKHEAKALLKKVKEKILDSLANDSLYTFFRKLKGAADLIASIEKNRNYTETPKVLITGEIYVRRDEFSRKRLEDVFAENGIITHISPVHEWIYYTDYLFLKKLTSPNSTHTDRLKKRIEILLKRYIEMKVKKIFGKTGFYEIHMMDVEETIEAAKNHLHPSLTGETILTVGTTLSEIGERYDGVVSIGPFGCMPSRIAEAIIKKGVLKKIFEDLGNAPIIYIESDGNPFPPIIESRIEAFIVQVKRFKGYKLKYAS